MTPTQETETITIQNQEYITTKDFGLIHWKSPETVKTRCRNGDIEGAVKIANRWLIPKDSPWASPTKIREKTTHSHTHQEGGKNK